jgi:outer membrane receptor protein involved in Fe transport
VVGAFYSRFVTRDAFDAENLGLLDQINYGIQNEGGPPVSSISDIFGVELYQGRYVISQHSKYTDTQKSLFAQVDYEVVPRVTLTAGLRYTATSFVYDNFLAGPLYTSNGTSETKLSKHNPITPRFGVSFQADRKNLFYASVAKGARGSNIADAVGFRCTPDGDLLGFNPMAPRFIKDDTVWSYEVGSKNRLFGGRVAIDASAYHIDWKDSQTVISLPVCRNHTIFSLGDAKIDGIDLALSVQPLDGLTLGASVSYMNARYASALTGPNNTIVRRKGEPLDVAPWSYHLSGEYAFALGGGDLYLRADFTGSAHDDTPLDLTSPLVDPMIPRAPGTAVLGLRAGARLGGLDVSLFANNVTNDNPVMGLGHETPGNINFRATAFRPRTIGITATFRR